MKKTSLFGIFAVVILFMGCSSLTDPKGYNEMQKAKWDAINSSATAYNARIETKLVDVNPNTGVVTVYNQNQHAPIVVRDTPSAFVQGADVILNSTVAKIVGGGWAIGYTAGKMQGNYTASGQGSIDVTKDSGNSHIIETGRETDNSVITTDSHDATATPTVVDQPAPVVVQAPDPVIVPGRDPVIVRPQVVNPVVVGGDNE